MQHQRMQGYKPLVWLGLISLVLAGAARGSYEFYTFRARQNTRKLLVRAQSAAAAEDWAGAASTYRQYLQRELDDVNALQSYADVLLQRIENTPGALADALRTLRRIIGLQPDNTDATAKLTLLFLRMREYTLAMELASGWIALAPTSAKATLALATAQHGLQRSRQAADTLVAAIARNPDEPEPYAMLVRLLTGELQQPDEAAKWVDIALRVGSDTANVHMAVFLFFQSQGKLDDAEEHLQRALGLAPESLDTVLPAGLFYLAQNRLDEAAAQLDDAARIAPQNPNVLAVRAMWATRTERPADLIATADDFFRVAGESHVGFLVQAAELYLGAGELGRTDDCLAKIDALSPVGKPLEVRLNLLRGTRAFQEGDYYSAIRHLRSAANGKPPSERALQLWAAAHARLGDLAGAAEPCERLIHLTPGNVDAHLRLAELEWGRGRLSRTREILASLPGTTDKVGLPTAGQQFEADLMQLACDLAEARRGGHPPTDRVSSLEELDRLAAMAPTGAFPTRWLVRCFALSGQPQQAVNLFHARLDDEESRPRLGVELGRLLLSDGLGEQVSKLADELIKRFPDAPQGYILQVRALAATDGLPQAAAYVDRNDLPTGKLALPVSARAGVLEALADEYLDAAQTETAIGLYRQAADLMTNNVSVRRKLVRSTSDLDEAVRRSEEIRAVEGDTGVHWKFEQASALLRLDPATKSLARARELLKQCLADRPRWPAARLLMGYAYELSGELHDAAEAYQTALARNPGLRGEPAAARLVQLQYRLGRMTEADALLESLTEQFPDQPAILRIRTEQQIRERNFGSALTTAERVLQLQPDDTAWAVVTADLHLRVADPARAEAIARTYLKRSPDSTTVLWILARALINQQRNAEALTQVREAAVAVGDAPHYVLLARVLARLDRKTETKQAITQAQTLSPDDPAIWAACADVWGSLDRRSQQMACMRKSVNLRGEDPADSLALARLFAAGDSAEERREASRIVQQRLSANPQDAEALVLRGQMTILSTRPNPASAEADFLKALSIDPRLPQAHRLLGLMRMRIGRVDAASASINRGLALAPHDPGLLLASSELYSVTGDYERAIRQLRRLLDIQPRMPAALRLLSNAYRATDQMDQGIAFIEMHAPSDVRNAGEIVLLAQLHESKQDFERAGLLYEKAAATDQTSSDVHQELLRFLARRPNINEIHDLAVTRRREHPADVRSFAVAAEMLGSQKVNAELREVGMGWLATIAREHPDHAGDATYRTALCHYRQAELREAESKFLEARRLAPTNRDLVNNFAWLYAVDLGKPADAVALIEQFLASGGSEDSHLLDTHCVALIRLGLLDAAEQKARQCLSISGNTPTRTAATYHLGVAVMKSGRENEARPHLRRAMQLDAQRGGLTAREQEDLRRLLMPAAPNPSKNTGQPGK
ncbi:MAG: tetratricopeptide repeat protein [Planctomycetes bacterium]|nr:tetratricopeptide repeat protein [Planctomycetota bacterium]